MAINHTTLFTKIAKLIKKGNSLATLNGTTLPADLQEIVNAYGTTLTGVTTSQAPIEGINAEYAALMNAVTSIRLAILSYSDRTVSDYDTVLSQIAGFSGAGLGGILYYLIVDFYEQSQTVESSVVTVGTPTANARNIGDGQVLVDASLDGYNPPLLGAFAHPLYWKVLSELAPASTSHVFQCVSSTYGTSQSPGGESFTWTDGFDFGEASGFGDNAGPGPGLTAARGLDLLGYGSFESWSSSAPTGWTIENGTAGTHVVQETGTVYIGDSCLSFEGDGSQEIIRISRGISDGLLQPLRKYCVSMRVRRVDTVPTSGTFDAHFVADGDYTTATGSESLYIPVENLSTEWELRHFYWTTPANLQTGVRFVLGIDETMTAGTRILVDDINFVPVVFHGGVSAVVVPGRTAFGIGDRLYCTVTSVEKVIQKFCRTHWKIQLPSTVGSSGSFGSLLTPYGLFTATSTATIPDSLAS